MPVNIYFIRHGKAEPVEENKPENSRKLTEEGIRIVEATALALKDLVEEIEFIVSSPLVRAKQTADIFHKEFNVSSEIITDKSLLNGGRTEDILALVESLQSENVALVGHQPDLAYHISKIISSSSTNLKIPASSLIKISFKGKPSLGRGTLEILLPPAKK